MIAQRDSTNTLTYLHGDNLGSTSLTTNSSGVSVSQQEFDPWGKVRSGGVSQTSMNYTGQKLDGTGLLFYNARYYDPAIGRFSSADTVADGLNRYSYVGNNPINATDPSGNCAKNADGSPNRDGDSNCWAAYDRNSAKINLGIIPGLDDLLQSQLDVMFGWLERNVRFDGANWTGSKLWTVTEGLNRVNNAFGDSDTNRILGIGKYGTLTFALDGAPGIYANVNPGEGNIVHLNNFEYSILGDELRKQILIETVVHELGHVVDKRFGRGQFWSGTAASGWGDLRRAGPRLNDNAQNSDIEDFAETFTYYVHTVSATNRADWRNRRDIQDPGLPRINALDTKIYGEAAG